MGLNDAGRPRRTTLNLSKICLGTMTFGSQVTESDAARMMDRALDSGVNFIDTANVYNQGLSEEITGRVLGARRQRVVLATKVRGKMGDGRDAYGGLAPAAVRRAAEASLRRLGTDCVDVYYLHMPDREVPIEDTLEAMQELRQAGKIRHIGVSNYAAWQMAEMDALMRGWGVEPPAVAQPMYNMLARGIEQEYLEFTTRYGIANACYNPLAGGLLTGKQSHAAGPLPGTRFDGNQMYLDRFWHRAYFRAVESLRGIAGDLGISMVELALRWACHREGVDSIIVGASKQAHLEENLRAAEGGPLPEDALRACDRVWQELRGPTPRYNR